MSRSSYYRKSKRYKKKNDKNILKYIIILIILVLLSIIFIINKSGDNSLNISLNNISAFKLSSENIIKLEQIAKKYNIDFAQMLTYYALENNFFDEKFYDVRTTLLLDKFNTEESPQQILERIKNNIRILYRSTAISLPENQLTRIKKYGIDKCVSGDKHIKLFREDNVDLFKQISIERAKILSKKN